MWFIFQNCFTIELGIVYVNENVNSYSFFYIEIVKYLSYLMFVLQDILYRLNRCRKMYYHRLYC